MSKLPFLFSLFFMFCICLYTNAQTNDSITVKEYELLYSRYQNSDTTLTKSEFSLLYYSSIHFQTIEYAEIHKLEQSLKACNRGAQYTQTLILGDSLLNHPYINLTALMECSFALNALAQTDKASYYFKRYSLFCKLIKLSGEGTVEKPYQTNTIGDAIEFMAFNNLYAVSDTKLENNIIKITLAKNKQKITTLYFLINTKGYVTDTIDN